ncbi:MAG TPA: hypothetical protein VMT54_02410 [Candidatus Cybelea sp.]|nr:hypothetical protein [Candidatus Cybelea sp.]
MPSETRRITFSSDELIQALIRLRRDARKPLPQSRIRGIKVENGEAGVPHVSIALDIEGESIELSPTEVAVALIKFCRQKKIPLPRRAEKSLAVDRGDIALVLHSEDR